MAPDLTGNILAFLAFLQDRSEVWAATVTLGATNYGRGVIWLFALDWTYSSSRVLLNA